MSVCLLPSIQSIRTIIRFLLNGFVVSLPIGDHLTVESLRASLETALRESVYTVRTGLGEYTVYVTGNVLKISSSNNFTLDFTGYELAHMLGFQQRYYGQAVLSDVG